MVFESGGRSHRDVIVILEIDGLHCVEGNVGEDHQVLTEPIPAVHCGAEVDTQLRES